MTALVTVYIVLGMLYESYIHPITILSTIPSAGVGALLALLLTHNELNVIGMIGIILLIGLVKKNAIMMIDVALDVERTQGKKPVEAIYDACILRFRPIMMTTMAALLGGLPLALGTGVGSELHRPLGITIVGGLIVSQIADAVHNTSCICLSRPAAPGASRWRRQGASRYFGSRNAAPQPCALTLVQRSKRLTTKDTKLHEGKAGFVWVVSVQPDESLFASHGLEGQRMRG